LTKKEGKNPMAYHVPYETDTVFPPNDLVAGNETSDSRVEFDIVPAWGSDLARIKSIVYAASGLAQWRDWTPQMQESVIAAFDSGAPAFQNTVTTIRNLSIPSIMAKRAGLILEVPSKVDETSGQIVPDPKAPYQVLTGLAFSMVVGALPAMGLFVASKIVDLSNKAEADPRLFGQPSGSGGPATASRKKGSTAGTARPTSRRRGTAAKHSATAGPLTGTEG